MSIAQQLPNLSSSEVELQEQKPPSMRQLSSADVEMEQPAKATPQVQWDDEQPKPSTTAALEPTQPVKPAPVQVTKPANPTFWERIGFPSGTGEPTSSLQPPPIIPNEQSKPIAATPVGGDEAGGSVVENVFNAPANAYSGFAARKGAEIAARNPSMRQMTPEEAQIKEADPNPAAHADVGGIIRERMTRAGSEFGANALESGVRQPVTGPMAGQTLPIGDVERGVVRGTGAFTGSLLADPSTYMLMGLGPESRFGRALMGAGFGVQMSQGSVESSEELGKVWDREDIPREQKIEMGTQAILGAVMASVSAKHGLHETRAIIQDYLNHIPEADRQAVQDAIDARINSAASESTQTATPHLSGNDVEIEAPEAKPAAKPERFRLPRGTSAAEVQGPVKGPNIRTVQVGDKTYAFDQRKINADGVTSAVERNELWRLTGGKAPEAAKVQAEQDVRGEEAPAVEAKPEERPVEQQTAPEVKWDDEKEETKPKHDFASTQINIEPKSEIGQRHAAAVAAIPEEHIGPNGREETPHVTVRYGLKDDSPEAIAKIKEAASKIQPFEAAIGKTGSFPATKEGDNPIIAHVEKSPELEQLRKTVEGAGDFKPDDHGEYKPHVTLGYVKPEHLAEHEGGNHLEGGKVPVDHVVVSKKDGTQEVIKLGGQQTERRTDIATRKRVADLTPEEKDKELLTSGKTGLPNQRAFEEDEHTLAQSHPHVGYADIDDFKRYNDALGHEGVDKAVLPAIGDLFRDAAAKEPGGSVKVYHRSGDEFNFRSAAPEAIKRVTERVNKELAETTFKYETKDGRILEKKGTGLSHGIGTDHESAEENSHADKQRRKEAGLREGARDVSAVDTRGAAGEQTAVRENTERERVPGKSERPAEEVRTAPRTTSPAEVNLRNEKQYTPGQRISGHEGTEAKLLTPSGGHAVRYRVVESGDLKTSHRSMDFSRNRDYPEGVQERQYHTSKEAQSRVIQQAQNYDPAYTINTNPDAVNGPPVVTPDGLVLGGNSRAMSTDRLYRSGRGNQYKGALIAQADQFGLDKEAIRGMTRPVLVRELTEAPKGIDELRRLGSDLNKSMTGALGVNERAASAGKSVTPETFSEISRMVNDGGDGATLRDVMRQNGKEIVRMMVKDGVITERERPQFVDTSTGGLSDEGKTFVERALMGSVVDEPGLMDRAPKAVLAKLEGSLADIASLASRTDEYNLLPILRQALEDHAEIAQSGSTVDDHLAQTGMFAPERNPAVGAMVRALARKPREFREAMKSFAADANHDVQGQSSLGFGEQPSASAAFNASFGTDFSEDQFTEFLLQSLEKGGTIGAEKKDVERAERTSPEVAESVHHDTPAPEAAGRPAGSQETGRAEPAQKVAPAAGSPEYESLKQKLAALETPNKTEAAPKPGPGIQRVADRLRTVADGLDKQIEDKQRPMTQNATPKRMREYRSRLHDGENQKRVQQAMRALADAHEAGTVPKGLENLRTKDEIYRLAYKGVEGGGGYYDVIPSQDYANKTRQGKALQGLMERHKNEPSEAKAERERVSKISQLEADVQFQKLPGYFPTPKPVVEKMLDLADIQPGDKVLEPSAGKGNIADLIKEREPEAKLSAIEPQSKLRQILELKGHELADSDSLGHKGQYDKIVMNPPFENGQDIDHVQHAFTLLKPGGKLVAIMSESPFFRNDRKGQAFREWLEEHGGTSEKLESGAFKESGTGVNARMVTIEKSAGAIPVSESRPAPGARGAHTGNETGRSEMEQLTASIKQNTPSKSLAERLKTGERLGVKEGTDVVSTTIGKLKGTLAAVKDALARPPKWGDYEDATGKWSGADQRSALELDRFSREIKKAVPDKLKREAISNWIEAGGDENVLQERAEKSSDKFKPGYEAALKLTDAEKTIARNVMSLHDATLQEAIKAGIVDAGVENYIQHVYKDKPEMVNRIRAEMNFNSLKTNPSFSKKRILPTYFDAEQAGFTPKDKDVGFLTAMHERSLREALAARGYIKSLTEGKAADGRPLVSASWASAKEIGDAGDEAYMVKPNLKPGEDYADYKSLDHPALRGWKWAGEVDGKPVFVQGDVQVHPEIYQKLKNNLSVSALRRYTITIGDKAIRPGAIALDTAAQIKQFVLSFSGFHQTTLAVHALEHKVIPVGMPELDLSNEDQAGLVDGGMMVAHYDAMDAFGEGVSSGGAVTKIPGIGPLYKTYIDYLFKSYMPRLKMKMGLKALEKNRTRYPELNKKQIFALTASQANAAFGGLNYRMLGRNKTFQDTLRLALMAPDFTEARGRFVGQAAKPYGREQTVALMLGALALYTAARAINQMSDDKPHWDKPFSVMHKGKEYHLRTVQGDVLDAVEDPLKFLRNRVSPPVSMVFKEDKYQKKHESLKQKIENRAQGIAPIPIQPWLRKSHDTNAQKAMESILKMIGVNETQVPKRAHGR